MKRAVAALASFAALMASAPVVRSQTPQATFRTATDLVTVPVTVRVSGTPVGGLKPSDFVLTDNGVRQTVETLESEAIPADITVLVETGEQMHAYMSTVNSQLQKIIAMVRPTDRLEVLGIDTYVTEILPLRTAAEQPTVEHLPAGRLASANDALVAALLRQSDETRRHLIIAITDTIDSMSGATYETVREAARHSTAQLEVAWVTMAGNMGTWDSSFERERGAICMISKRCEPRARYFMPQLLPRARTWDAFAALREAAEMTGGEVHPPGVFTDRTAASIFDRVYNDYRRAYLLRYTRTGVPASGWHDIAVTIPAHPSYDITARRGYFAEAAASVTSPPEPEPGSIEALVAAGAKGDDEKVNRVIAQAQTQVAFSRLMRDFESAARWWPGSTGEEFIVAFRLAFRAVFSTIGYTQDEGVKLLRRYAEVARQTAPGFERRWWLLSVGLAEATLSGPMITSVANDAAERLPDEGRFILAKAIGEDVRWRIGDATVMSPPNAKKIAELKGLFLAATAFPETHDEALVRAGFFLYRAGRTPEALELLTAAGDTTRGSPGLTDLSVRYWRELFLGHVLDVLGRVDDAAAAYRRAMALAPGAQSARVALMTTLARHGGPDEARRLAEETLATEPAPDPWNEYWGADARRIQSLLNELRTWR